MTVRFNQKDTLYRCSNCNSEEVITKLVERLRPDSLKQCSILLRRVWKIFIMGSSEYLEDADPEYEHRLVKKALEDTKNAAQIWEENAESIQRRFLRRKTQQWLRHHPSSGYRFASRKVREQLIQEKQLELFGVGM